MNKNTKESIQNFINQVEIMAQGVVHLTGTESCANLVKSAEALKDALDSDETIV